MRTGKTIQEKKRKASPLYDYLRVLYYARFGRIHSASKILFLNTAPHSQPTTHTPNSHLNLLRHVVRDTPRSDGLFDALAGFLLADFTGAVPVIREEIGVSYHHDNGSPGNVRNK